MDDLGSARKLANRVRFREDTTGDQLSAQDLLNRVEHKNQMLRSGLLISADLTPSLEDVLSTVCARLLIPRECVSAFVYNSPSVQADCLVDSPDSCVLRFSSSLINLMKADELEFVTAHELGHFLLGHGACSQDLREASPEKYLSQRAAELSADRIGLLGSGSLTSCVKAILKTVSGLTEDYIRFDIANFLSQAKHISSSSKGESLNSSHPSLLIRCKSILWFSTLATSNLEVDRLKASEIREIDDRVNRDLEKFVDGRVRIRRKQLADDITLWNTCMLIISEGAFSKDLQKKLAHNLSESHVEVLKTFFDSHAASEVEYEAKRRFDICKAQLYREFPDTAADFESDGISKAYTIAQPL